MSNYTKSTNFATKDNLSPGNPLKIVKGAEIDTEFNNIQTAVATKTDNASANITGGSITGITDLAVADGGTGASTAAAALNNLLPAQTGNANKYLQTDGTNASWDAVSLSTSDITGTLPVLNGGTGVTTATGTGNVVLSNSPTLVTPALGTPASGTATNLTGLPISTGVSGLGTGVATFLGTPSSANLASAVSDETGSGALVFANSPTLVTPALGTPSALVGTNITGTASGLTAGNVTTNANLTGAVTSVGNATSLGSFSSSNLAGALTDETGSGSAVFATSPTLVTPILGTPTSATLTNATGLPISTGVSGLGTGVATALAVNTGSSGAVVVNGGALGTPSGGTATNLTGLPLSTGVTGTLPVANGGTGQTSYTDGQLLIGNTTGNTLSKATLTQGTGITITNGNGTITIAATGGGGSGDVVGPASSTDNALARFDTTTGKLLQNSVGILSDTGAISGLTDISASGSVTLSGGTANGVTYLNGSKVLTSGSALVFDGANLGVGVTPSTYWTTNGYKAIDIGSAGCGFTSRQNNELTMCVNNAYNIYSVTGVAASKFGMANTGAFFWQQAPAGTAGNTPSFTTAMTLDASANLLLGVTSAAAGRLAIKDVAGSGNNIWLVGRSSDGTSSVSFRNNADTAYNARIECFDTGVMTFATGTSATERLRIDSAGNLGLGVTPSAWGSAIRAVQVNNTGMSLFTYNAAGTVDQYAFLSNNSFQNSSYVDTYVRTNPAAQYRQLNATHAWYTAPSGTAGNTITFTQAMTLTAGGDLGIGTTSPTTKLDLTGNSANSVGTAFSINNKSQTTQNLTFIMEGASGDGQTDWTNSAIIEAYQPTASTGTKALYLSAYNGPMIFATNARTQAARIDSSGNLLVGTTSASGKLFSSTSSASQPALRGASTSATYADNIIAIDADRNTTNNTFYAISYYNNGAAAHKFRVADSGNVTNTNNSYGAISDVKLKENIVDASPKLADLMQVKVRSYNMIGDTTKQLGVVAQELETVFPAMVEQTTDRDKDGNDLGTTTKAVKYSVFVPMLIKVLQEQQAIIETLKARLDAANL